MMIMMNASFFASEKMSYREFKELKVTDLISIRVRV